MARTAGVSETHSETTGGEAHTWTNYTNAGGYEGPLIAEHETVQIACRVQGFKVEDGDTWWYLIASSPWNSAYYVSADPFYNNGETTGPLLNTPFFDPNVPECGTEGIPETTGSETHTWTNYGDAGGTQGTTIGGQTTVRITCKVTGFPVADGNTWWYRINQAPWNNSYYASADAFYNNGETSGSLLGTPFVDEAVPTCPEPSEAGATAETAGGEAHTWTNFADAGGTQGPTVEAHQIIEIECKTVGFQVADGNTWWYRIKSAPWSGAYYVSADAFYNGAPTSGSLLGTPFVDERVPSCPSGLRPGEEITGGEAQTWANYSHAGAQQGPTIPPSTAVSVSCRVQGFAVADGNTWWYLVASSPWNNVYYVSADAFYNGAPPTGSLKGTPFVDPSIPVCVGNHEAPISTAVGSSSAVAHSTGCVSGRYPIDCASGDFWHTFTDVSLGGRGPGLQVTRTYNTFDAVTPGIFGYGWSSSLDQRLTLTEDGTILITLSDGSQIPASPNGSGGFTLPASADASLQLNTDGTYTLTEHATELLSFSAAGKLLALRDLDGYQTTLAYNGSGQLATVTDASGRSLSVTFGSNGFVSSITDPLGRSTGYSYDSAGDLISTTDPMGRTWSFSYDEHHRLLTMTDPRGGVVTNTYDSQSRVIAQTDPAGLTTTYAYTGDNFSSLGGTTTIKDPHGSVTIEQYANGFMTEITKAAGTAQQGTWTYTYDPNTFGTTSTTDPKGHVTTSAYDVNGQLLSTTDPLGHKTTYSYNELQEPLTSTTPLGKTTTRTYDANGNLTSVTDPLGNVTRYSYEDAHTGDVTAITEPEGRVEHLTYDSYGDVASRSVSPSSGVTDTTSYVYDQDGELVCEASADGATSGISCPAAGSPRVNGTTTKAYDADGELTSATDADGHTTTYGYDADGNQTQLVDPSGNITDSVYDADSRLISKTTGANATSPSTTTYAYDLLPGQDGCQAIANALYCTTATNPDGGATVKYYDARNQEIQESRPGGQKTQYTYDLAGNKATEKDASGRTTTYGHDADNRLTSIGYSGGATPNVKYAYNADDDRTSMTDGTGTTTYTYDADDRVTSVTNGAGTKTTYGYNKTGDITSVGYPNGQTIKRGYNGAGQLVSVTDWLGDKTTFGYDPSGNLTTTTYPNGDVVNSSYEPTGAMSGTAVALPHGEAASITYTRNADGLISQESDAGIFSGTTAYAYDTKNEVAQAGTTGYGYDSAGNLTTNGVATQAFGVDDELKSATTAIGATTYHYDTEGDRTSTTPVWGLPTQYSYDQAGRLTAASESAPTPDVTGVSPATGPTAGGTTVTIKGSGFTEATAVTFGGIAATNVDVLSDTKLTAAAPAGAAGAVDVEVSGPAGTSTAVAADRYAYALEPAITGISPVAGPTRGTNTVTIIGAGFTGATKVLFGGASATNLKIASDTELTVTAPAGTGAPTIVVKNASQTSKSVAVDKYTYTNGPAVAGVSPAAGPTTGETTVTVTGAGFTGTTSVLFGATPATNVDVISDTRLTATAPAGSATTAITVTTAAGPSTNLTGDHYSYEAVPQVGAVTPSAGPTTGNAMLTITGSGFSNATAVAFAGVPAISFKVLSDTSLLAIAPAGTATADITVTTLGGTSAKTAADVYSYLAAPTSYAYNGDGLRMSETTASGVAQFTWDSTPSVPEIISDASMYYVSGPGGLPIEQIDHSGNATYFFHDANGSTRALLAANGSAGATFTYNAYGGIAGTTGSLRTPLLYGQGYTDQTTGLVYLVHRYYDPQTGQFMSVDPAVEKTEAPYRYAEEDPVNGRDPAGDDACAAWVFDGCIFWEPSWLSNLTNGTDEQHFSNLITEFGPTLLENGSCEVLTDSTFCDVFPGSVNIPSTALASPSIPARAPSLPASPYQPLPYLVPIRSRC
jgi:RHS repeat-associated protein